MKPLKHSKLICFFCLLFCWACNDADNRNAQDASQKLHSLFEEEWSNSMKENPLWATSLGVSDYNDQFPSVTVADQKRRAEHKRAILEQLNGIDRNNLNEQDQVNYDLFKFIIQDEIDQDEFESYLVPFYGDESFYVNFLYAVGDTPFETVSDFEKYISRLKGFENYVDQHLGLMRTGIEKGWVLPKVITKDYEKRLEQYLVDDPKQSWFYKPFDEMPERISDAQQQQLREQAQKAIAVNLVPAFQKFAGFMKDQYYPNSKSDLGAASFPNGKAYYQQRVKYYTTLDISPDEVYTIGEKEVARIRAEMETIVFDELKYKADFPHFINNLRTNPRFYAKQPDDLLYYASYLSKKIDGKLPAYFGKLPRLSYGVQPVPAAIAPNYTAGRYSPGSATNHKAGNYLVNTHKLESRPLYALPALTLHEAVPGHHLQIALAEEMENVPEFRKHTYLSSYGEGWALYCEHLGLEMGMYEDPYDHFGKLTYEMWRACRLVVDVGLHWKGWTRQQAIEFMASNTALSLHEVNTEIDRYIAWPGQALSYKMGELKIRELRKKAETNMKEQFNIRDFHDLILSQGSVPMYVLEKMVDQYIQQKK